MGTLIMVTQLLLGLSLLVFVHELGHFLAAKAFGMRVPKFYIFFDAWDKKIWSKKIGDTEYGIGWLPLGGYVQISGMIDETQDKEALNHPPEPWEFRSKPAWQRFIVMIGGVTMNVIVGLMIFAMHLHVFEKDFLPISEVNQDGIFAHQTAQDIGFQTGDKIVALNGSTPERFKELKSTSVILGGEVKVNRGGSIETIDIPHDFYKTLKERRDQFIEPMYQHVLVSDFAPDSNAEKAGMQKGDRIKSLNNQPIDRFSDLQDLLKNYKDSTVNVTVDRNGADATLQTKVDTAGRLGFFPTFESPYNHEAYGWGGAVKYSFKDGYEAIASQMVGFYYMLTGKLNVVENLTSPIGIARIYGSVWDWDRFWYLTGLISFILAFMNLLPIPALDGGHIMFIFIESIIGRRLSDDFMEKAQIFGFVLLLCLMVFAFGIDIWKGITGNF